MPTINLRHHYPHYTEDVFVEISDAMNDAILFSIRQENNYQRRRRYHHALYSLDVGDGIERSATRPVPTPEELWVNKLTSAQLQEALSHLSSVQASRIKAHFLQKQKIRAIALKENVSASTVSQSIRQGLKMMKKYYEMHF